MNLDMIGLEHCMGTQLVGKGVYVIYTCHGDGVGGATLRVHVRKRYTVVSMLGRKTLILWEDLLDFLPLFSTLYPESLLPEEVRNDGLIKPSFFADASSFGCIFLVAISSGSEIFLVSKSFFFVNKRGLR